MEEIIAIIWLFPILFMIHDFEEIIFIKEWNKKSYYKDLKVKPFKDFISTASFSLAVAQEFLFFSLVTYVSYITDSYFLWFGLFSGITIHFIVHSIMSIVIKKYHPGLLTSILLAPIGVYLLYISATSMEFHFTTIITSSIVGIIILLGNLKLLHILMPKFNRLIKLI